MLKKKCVIILINFYLGFMSEMKKPNEQLWQESASKLFATLANRAATTSKQSAGAVCFKNLNV